jgi:hypothetical protein
MPPVFHLEVFPMFDLIVLGLVLAGVALIARAPASNRRSEVPRPAVPAPWSAKTDWHRFHKPTYLRRGIVPGGREVPSNSAGEPHTPNRKAQLTVHGETS